jgi:hypothetical protein
MQVLSGTVRAAMSFSLSYQREVSGILINVKHDIREVKYEMEERVRVEHSVRGEELPPMTQLNLRKHGAKNKSSGEVSECYQYSRHFLLPSNSSVFLLCAL